MTQKQPNVYVKTATLYTTGRDPDADYVARGLADAVNSYFGGEPVVTEAAADALAWGKHENPRISLDKLFRITIELVETTD